MSDTSKKIRVYKAYRSLKDMWQDLPPDKKEKVLKKFKEMVAEMLKDKHNEQKS